MKKKKITNTNAVSNCCKADLLFAEGDEGTNYYICAKCNKSCDAYFKGEFIEDKKIINNISVEMINKTHILRIDKIYYKTLRDGEKTCEVRKNDRDYQKGDCVELRCAGDYPNLKFKITHILSYFPDGLKEGYVVLSLKPL
jgi:hypothetical protein